MTQVFALVHYDFLTMPGVFKAFADYVGHFQIQQTVMESYSKVFQLWFYTDKIEIKEGEVRQVDVRFTQLPDDTFEISISKL